MRPLDHRSGFLEEIIGVAVPDEGGTVDLSTGPYLMKDGILRRCAVFSPTQRQTQNAFGYLWSNSTFDDEARAFQAAWFEEHFPGVRASLAKVLASGATILDAGCGAAWSALSFFGDDIDAGNYVGVDISIAVERAASLFRKLGRRGEFLQDTLVDLPFRNGAFDVIFSPGVLHHTDDVEVSLGSLSRLLSPGGVMLFWVYRRQPPLRDFADRFIRQHLSTMTDEEAFVELQPLTRLGEALGRLRMTVEVPEAIPYLGIPKGPVDVQRLFYYYVVKTFYNERLPFERANMQNFDWYRPLNAHTCTLEDVERYCRSAGLLIDWHQVSPSGISVLARRGD